MATEHIPQIDNLIKDFGKRFCEDVKQASKAIEQVGKAIKKYQESEEKSMLHSVTVKHEENKVLESYYVMCGTSDMGIKKVEKELDNEPTPYEIAQFLSDSKADFVSVVQNYRFVSELPF